MYFLEKVAAHHNAIREGHYWVVTNDQMIKIESNMARDYANKFSQPDLLIKEKDIVKILNEHSIFLENHR